MISPLSSKLVEEFRCRICGNSENNTYHIAKEMMYGSKDVFNYVECSVCECLQISEIPLDVEKYYPVNYYSYQFVLNSKAKFKLMMKAFVINNNFHYSKLIKNKTNLFKDYGFLDILYQNKCLSYNSNILDIGCGCGALLLQLKYLGFKNLKGIDPFIESTIDYKNGVSIDKKHLHELDQYFDLIMLHHSFEHMEDPEFALGCISRQLSANGFILIRIPIVPCFAWQHYGVNWVQLDAPRHLYLHSIKSMQTLAEKSGLEIVNISFDSTEFQFCGSEQYLADKPLISQSNDSFSEGIIFTEVEIEKYRDMAINLNKEGKGDQACFLLRKNSF